MITAKHTTTRTIELPMTINDALAIECRETAKGNLVSIRQLSGGVIYICITMPATPRNPQPNYINATIDSAAPSSRHAINKINQPVLGGAS